MDKDKRVLKHDNGDLSNAPSASRTAFTAAKSNNNNNNNNSTLAPTAVNITSKVNTRRGKIRMRDNYTAHTININNNIASRNQYTRTSGLVIQHATAKNTDCWQLKAAPTFFAGRTDKLAQLNETLSQQSTCQGVCIQGYAGMGKTALALQFANTYANQYVYIGFIDANNNAETVESACIDFLSANKKLSISNVGEPAQILPYAFGEWSKQGPILIILDNVKDYSAVANLLTYAGSAPNIRFIITSRIGLNRLKNFERISLNNFNEQDAAEFIQKGLIDQTQDQDYIEEYKKLSPVLAKELFYFPLSLSHAIAYLDVMPGMQKFIDAFKDESSNSFITDVFEKNEPLFQGVATDTESDVDSDSGVNDTKKKESKKSAFTLFALAYKKSVKNNNHAKEALALFALLGEADIPFKLIKKLFNDGDANTNSALHALKQNALITSGKNKDTYAMHGMVQLIIRCLIKEERQYEHYFTAITDLFDREFHVKETTQENWQYFEQLAEHVPALLKNPSKKISHARIYYHLAKLHFYNGHLKQARDAIKKAMTFIPEDNKKIVTKYLLLQAEIDQQEGGLKEVEYFLNQNKTTDNEKLQLKIHKLATKFYKIQGKFDESIKHIESALRIAKQLYKGKYHVQQLDLYAMAADVYAFAGKTSDNETYLQRMQDMIDKNKEKIEFFSRIKFAQLLSRFYQENNVLDKAIYHARQAVELSRTFHSNTPNQHSVESLMLLANCYQAANNFQLANTTFADCEKEIKGIYDNDNNLSMSLLYVYQADLLHKQELHDDALVLYNKSMSIVLKYYGHIPTREISVRWYRIANVYIAQNKYQEAQEACKKGYDILKAMGNAGPIDELSSTLRTCIYISEKLSEDKLNTQKYLLELEELYPKITNPIHRFSVSIFIYYRCQDDQDKKSIWAVEIKTNIEQLPDNINQADVYQNIGFFHESVGNVELAKNAYQNCCQLIESENVPEITKKTAWNRYGKVCFAANDFETALLAYQRVWHYTPKFNSDSKKEVITVIDYIVHCYHKTKSWDKLLEYITEDNMGTRNKKQALQLMIFFFRLAAEKLYKEKQYAQAIKFYECYFDKMQEKERPELDAGKINTKTEYTLFLARRNLAECYQLVNNQQKSSEILTLVLTQLESITPSTDPYENAVRNLQVLGIELGIDAEYDENRTCIFGLDNEFSLHITFEPQSKRLYMYSPLLNGLPENLEIRHKLYEYLLEQSMLGGKILGGGIGVATKEELILFHIYLDMEDVSPFILLNASSFFVQKVEQLRNVCRQISQGQKVNLSKDDKPVPVANFSTSIENWFKDWLGYITKFPSSTAKKVNDKLFDLRYQNAANVREGFDIAKQQLVDFGAQLALDNLQFDENNSCILGIDNTFSLHITYEPNSAKLYIYSPLLDGLPTDIESKLSLYELLLHNAMLGGQMAGGGVGVAVKEDIVLMHASIDVKINQMTLSQFAAIFVETVEKNRAQCQAVVNRNQMMIADESIASLKNHPAYISRKTIEQEKLKELLSSNIEKVKRLDETKKNSPSSVPSLLNIAKISVDLKDYHSAKIYIDSADEISRMPSSSTQYVPYDMQEVSIIRAWVYFNSALATCSVTELICAVRCLSHHFNLSQYLYAANERVGGEALLKLQEKALKEPDAADANCILANVLVAQTHYQAAFKGYALGFAVIQQGSFTYKCYLEALKNISKETLQSVYENISIKNARAFIKKIWLDYPKENNNDVVKYLIAELENITPDDEVLKSLAEFYLQLNELDKAKICYEKITQKKPDDYYTLACISMIRNQGNPEEDFKQSTQSQTQQSLIYYGNFLYGQGRYQEALNLLSKVFDIARQQARDFIHCREFELSIFDESLRQLMITTGHYKVDTVIFAYYLLICCHVKNNNHETASLVLNALELQINDDVANTFNKSLVAEVKKQFSL